MTARPGPTETRVRAALLRLWERDGKPAELSWTALDVREEVINDGQTRLQKRTVERAGLGVSDGWYALGGGAEYTYERGVFRARRQEPASGPDTNPSAAEIERGLSEGCRFALAASREGCVDGDAGSGRTNNALRRRELLDDRDPVWLRSMCWGRPLTPLGKEVAALAKISTRPGGGSHPKGPNRSHGRMAAKPCLALTKALADIKTIDEPASDEDDAPAIKTINPLDTLDERDATVQVTWGPGASTAIVTVRRKDSDLTPAQLRSLASALLEAAEDMEAAP